MLQRQTTSCWASTLVHSDIPLTFLPRYTDEGASGSDLVDGVMEYIDNPPCRLAADNSFLGTEGKVCRFVAGGSSDLTLKLDKISNQTIYYVAKDTSGLLNVVTRVVQLQDTTPPIMYGREAECTG